MMATQQDEIVERGLAAIRPVADMMRIDEAMLRAARKTATAVAYLQGAAHRRGYGTGLAADIERVADLVSGDSGDAAIAGDATRGIRRQPLAIIELTALDGVCAKRFRGNVYHDLVAFG